MSIGDEVSQPVASEHAAFVALMLFSGGIAKGDASEVSVPDPDRRLLVDDGVPNFVH